MIIRELSKFTEWDVDGTIADFEHKRHFYKVKGLMQTERSVNPRIFKYRRSLAGYRVEIENTNYDESVGMYLGGISA
tara:strand:- start:334 stop:564 length:231 start_codon:yes stop_codon:yes gene_type:complete